jgi:hypothetical protein
MRQVGELLRRHDRERSGAFAMTRPMILDRGRGLTVCGAART